MVTCSNRKGLVPLEVALKLAVKTVPVKVVALLKLMEHWAWTLAERAKADKKKRDSKPENPRGRWRKRVRQPVNFVSSVIKRQFRFWDGLIEEVTCQSHHITGFSMG